jgi:hypothetical protein
MITGHLENHIRMQRLPGELHAKAAQMIGALDYEVARLMGDLAHLMPHLSQCPSPLARSTAEDSAPVFTGERLAA